MLFCQILQSSLIRTEQELLSQQVRMLSLNCHDNSHEFSFIGQFYSSLGQQGVPKEAHFGFCQGRIPLQSYLSFHLPYAYGRQHPILQLPQRCLVISCEKRHQGLLTPTEGTFQQ